MTAPRRAWLALIAVMFVVLHVLQILGGQA